MSSAGAPAGPTLPQTAPSDGVLGPLAATRRRLSEIQRIAGIAWWELDLVTLEMEWSDELYRMYGVSPETFVPTLPNVLAQIVPEDRDRVLDAIGRATTSADVVEAEWRALHPTRPDVRVLHGRGEVVRNASGEPVALHGTAQDVTEKRRLEAELEEAQRAGSRQERLTTLGTLAAGIAHEINNPLMFVQGNIEFAQASLDELERGGSRDSIADLGENLSTALRGLRQIEQLTRGLKMLTRQSPSPQQNLRLTDVVDHAIALARPTFPTSLRVDLDMRAAGSIVADESALCQAVVNLLVNAVEAMAGAPTPVLSVSLVETTSHVELTVADQGVGVSDDLQAQMFTPFFTTKPQGTGLGLSMSAAIIHNHGGTLSLAPRPGGGTACVVRLPRVEPGPGAPSVPPARPIAMRPALTGAAWQALLRAPERHRHLAYLYQDDAKLLRTITRWILPALQGDGTAIVICTKAHAEGLQEGLEAEGFDAEDLTRRGRLIVADAHELLARFLRDGRPDREILQQIVEEFTKAVASSSPSADAELRVWGEMVDILWREDRRAAARSLEAFWCEAVRESPARLLCSYSDHGAHAEHDELAAAVTPSHSVTGRDH